jgi:Ca-activated chloride channel family protein
MIIHYWRRKRVLSFFGKGGPGDRAAKVRLRYWAASLAFLAFFAFAVTALAGPRWGIRLVPEFRRGVDVVLAFDLSRSMDVRDVGGGVTGSGNGPSGVTRLEQAAAIALELVSKSGGTARHAIAIGKGQGILAVPLTSDAEAVFGFLDGIATSSVTGRGTNLEKLIDAAASAFKDNFPGKRRIILFSDGESLTGSLSAACDRALARDISIIAVGLGTEAGGAVPQAEDVLGLDPAAGKTGGQGVISQANPEALRGAAARTGGIYLDGNSAGTAALLAELLAEDARQDSGNNGGETGFRRELKSRRYMFILAALAAFGLSKLLACVIHLPPSGAPSPKTRRPHRE